MQDPHHCGDNQPTDPQRPDRPMSEISHLFLSNIRDRARNGAPPPRRKPPVDRKDLSIDLTPEEFAQVFSEPDHEHAPTPLLGDQGTTKPRAAVHAVLAWHLNGHRSQRLSEYASHLCMTGAARVGLIDIEPTQLRLSVFEHGSQAAPVSDAQAAILHRLDVRRIAQTLEELSWDVDHWLLIVHNPRLPEARRLLQQSDAWVLLTCGDHDGVVSGYRTLKSLADPHPSRVSLALLDLDDELQARRIARKLDGVCRQFLGVSVDQDVQIVAPVGGVIEHVVLSCVGSSNDQPGPHWQVVGDFLLQNRSGQTTEPTASPAAKSSNPQPTQQAMQPQPDLEPSTVGSIQDPTQPLPEVLDLPDHVSGHAALTAALVRGVSGLVECPIKPPMCPEACLAVTRERQLLLVAAASRGLSDLRSIGRAYQWMIENRPLIAMALPQFGIDVHRLPRLELLVDHSDLSADVLQPLLGGGNVLVRAYRKLRWGNKTGLLLEAA